jgi:hypothetical protein
MYELSQQMIQLKDIERCKHSNEQIKEVCSDCQHALPV